ncbi:hypothetical protein BBF93_11420 [Hyphomonas sp. CACIAM 19H1]|uniref:DUF4129 domain-containing protein n=1 Tax=Hyphomonas sp. CACIAM 19H1 TaxID=1873716 RepID=UPI000DEDF889|nr:DUF4129 domain-containing protein [Hyphomonas sp. CACIAM 19H1]AXE64767.1 hypothetical protein BBF93_11420 [Hyphomonas sp. CACIAM 19H1]
MVSLVRSSALALAASVFLFVGAPALAQNRPPSAAPPTEYSDEADPEYYDDYGYETDYNGSSVGTDVSAVERAHRAYLRDGDLQLARPEQADIEIEPREPPGWIRAIGEFLEALGPLFKLIFWIAAGAVILGLLYFLFGEAIRMRLGFTRKEKVKAVDDVLTDIRPDADRARSLLEEADALAREGRFAEAVHLLLFRSIEDVQERLEGGVPTSLTAREIAGLGSLPDRARRALRPIIQIVENSFFGGRDVDAEGWQNARRSYEDFAFGEGWA